MYTINKLGNTIFAMGAQATSLLKAAAAGITGAALAFGNVKRAFRTTRNQTKKPVEGFYMKKSTAVALFAALAAIAGVLGALYVYVLRREKELDEYEQLLFSEEFDDDDADSDALDALDAEEATAKAATADAAE